MIKTICYLSDSIAHESMEKLETLYLKARANNKKNNITGVLIYNNLNFLQVLEGEEEVVNATFDRIRFDRRHRNIFEVINTTVDVRIFEDYNFGFTIVNSKSELKNLYDYLEWLRNGDHKLANDVINMVENFIDRKS
ncbi:BLUF domain-containing protein [Seonamhaeicola sp. ML3]|uniref:BLUF domain-containing protein n=1 Tax=Seonamhaeicola sp. ML3 TaxID=2937786 RepID=UPI0020105BDC|nr:BLUF domain-containing protein [Seonamhaeicola sp. ML3]